MRLIFLLAVTSLFSCSVFSQTETLFKNLEKLKNGFIISAISDIEKEANKGDVWSQFILGVCYENGYGVTQNNNAAFKLYRKTAESGLTIGQYCVSICYRKGIGTSRNIGKAEYWIEKAKGRYDLEFLTLVDACYQEGLKYPQNYSLGLDVNRNLSSVNNVIGNNINSNNTTINITYANPQPAQTTKVEPLILPVETEIKSDVDISIPQGIGNNEYTFVVIIANENYRRVEKVPYANNDGEIFKKYCMSVLDVPEKNIKYVADASLNDLKYNLNWLKQVMDVYQGGAKVVFYYAGHGIPDEANKTAYLLPVDGYTSDIATGYSLKTLYGELGQMPAKSVLVLLDACFSGTKREGDMLASARGVAIKVKPNEPKGKLIVFSAAQGDETAYPYKEQRHGMFTYYLLKKLQETKGEATLGEISDYVTSEVRKQSIVINGKMQTPTLTSSSAIGDTWRNWKLK